MRRVARRRVFGFSGLAAGAAVSVAALWLPLRAADERRGDAEAALPVAAHGTRFHFEIIESCDARYLGDTPAHSGKDGGLTVRPQVALGDPVSSTRGDDDVVVGRITRVAWSRVSGSLEVEFHPEPLVRIAVGDEVWIDLNPAPPAERARQTP